MLDLCRLIWRMFTDLFRLRATLEAEILVLRQQINVLRRGAPRKLAFNPIDRLIFIGLYRLFAQTCRALAIVKPDTVINGTARASDRIGAGNRDAAAADQRCRWKFAG